MDKPGQRDDEEKPIQPHERKQPTTPADPAEKPKEEYPRRMRWPADFPANIRLLARRHAFAQLARLL